MEIGNTEVTNMVMIHNKETNQVLVQNRIKSWTGIAFPGGHLEANESIMESAIREVKEETGLDVKNLQFCGIVHWNHTETGDQTFIHYYKTNDFSGELISDEEEGKNFWVDLDKIMDMDLAPGFEIQIDLFFNDCSELLVMYNDDDLCDEPLYKWQY